MSTLVNGARFMALVAFKFIAFAVAAQLENSNWVLDGDIWIDFNSGVPIVKDEPMEFSTIESAASISDSLGNLLFYTNGVEVYNRLGEVVSEMEIPIDDTLFYKSLTQGVLILPEIGSPNVYRIIGLGRYALIDMALNGGLGGMLTFPSWHSFESDTIGFAEKNIAIRHGNGLDWWILQLRLIRDYTADSYDSVFVSFLYNDKGINKSQFNRINTRTSGETSIVGDMTTSIQGNLVAISFFNSLLVYEFDRCSGVLGSEIAFIDSISPIYSCSFSPSGRFVYFNTSSGWVSGNNVLYQLDLNRDQFGKHIVTEIYRRDEYGTFANGQIELGLDQKLYMTASCNYLNCELFSPLNMHLSVINYPDRPGLACDFDTLGLYLGGRRTMWALPNTVNYSLGALEGSECDTLNNTTAIQSIETLAIQWQVFPTLSSGRFTFSGPANALFSVSDVWGRSVPYERLSNNEFDLGALPAGIYLIQASHHNEQQTFKVLKQ